MVGNDKHFNTFRTPKCLKRVNTPNKPKKTKPTQNVQAQDSQCLPLCIAPEPPPRCRRMGLSRKPWHDVQPPEPSSTGRNGRCTESYSFLRGLEQEITWMTSFWETPVTPRTLPAQGNSTPCLSITPSTPCRVTERVQVKSKTRLGKTRNPTKSRSLASFLLLH